MRHHQDRSAAGPGRDERGDEDLLTLMVEPRIGLVEDKGRRIAEQRARESQALSLPVAELRVVRAGPGRVATGKSADDLLQSGRSRCRDHRLGRGEMKACDRIRHGSARELLALRHGADEAASSGEIGRQAGDGSRPPAGVSTPAARRSAVDFPLPFGPFNTASSPGATARLTPSTMARP